MITRGMMFLALICSLALTGCIQKEMAYDPKGGPSGNSETASLRAELDSLRAENQSLRQELDTKDMMLREVQDTSAKKKALPSAKDIQEALLRAGFYKGKVDGKIGRMTKEAIKAFQTANGLNPDGVVGSKTWEKLSEN